MQTDKQADAGEKIAMLAVERQMNAGQTFSKFPHHISAQTAELKSSCHTNTHNDQHKSKNATKMKHSSFTITEGLSCLLIS